MTPFGEGIRLPQTHAPHHGANHRESLVRTLLLGLLLIAGLLSGCDDTSKQEAEDLSGEAWRSRQAELERLMRGCVDGTDLQPPETQVGNCLRYARETKDSHLDLSRRGFIELPDILHDLDHVTSLDAGDNQLSTLPPSIKNLRNLRSISLSANQFTTIPPVLFDLPRLEILKIGDNPILTIDPSINRLDRLVELRIIGGQLTTLPDSLAGMHRLRILSLEYNRFTTLPIQSLATAPNLEYVSFSNNELSEIPPDISKLRQLKGLFIGFNQLRVLPAEIGDLHALRFLDIWGNELTTLPPALARLPQLQRNQRHAVLGMAGQVPLDAPSMDQLENHFISARAVSGINAQYNNIRTLDPTFCAIGLVSLMQNPLSDEAWQAQCRHTQYTQTKGEQ